VAKFCCQMNRGEALRALDSGEHWDVLVIGGGATGLGAAVDAAARGFRTVLLEQHDFAKGTSSRSTKLVHGGVRYLRQGNIGLVRESLRERSRLLHNAPHVTRKQSFIVPAYAWVDRPFYGVGLKLYDALAGRFSLGPSQIVSREEALRELPTIQTSGLRGGVRYFDGQFDDARLAVSLAQTVFERGSVAVNYVPVIRLLKENERVTGVIARDAESGREFEVRARAVINATGVFTDAVRQLEEPDVRPLVAVSQGAHIVVDRSFLPGESALMVPKTADGRVLFAIPWLGRVVIGTTDVPVAAPALEPRPLAQEIEFLLEHAARYLARAPRESDILSTFAGLRPLVKSAGARATSKLSRDHTIVVSRSGLITIAGGKWTTYRKMGEDVVDEAIRVGGLPARPAQTADLPLARATEGVPYGTPSAPWEIPAEEIVRAVRAEMARTVEDVLARRSRLLLLEARAAIAAAPRVAEIMAAELGRDEAWRCAQLKQFVELARNYCWPPATAHSS